MAAVISAILASVAAAYIVPRAMQFAWGNGFTWLGKTFGTWAVVALLYDMLVNNGDGRNFTAMDLGASAAITLAVRVVI